MEYLTAKEAAILLGLNDSRIRQLARESNFVSKRFGRSWMLGKESVLKFRSDRRKCKNAS
jgi:excisionase family DNA binding protein